MSKTKINIPTNARKRSPRKQSHKFLIIGDGASEQVYFEGFIGRNRCIKVISKGSGKTGMKQTFEVAARYVRDCGLDLRDGDRVAIVMDTDFRYGVEEMEDIRRRCAAKGYELYASNPCFEVWLLLHFQRYSRYSTADELVERLNAAMLKQIGKPYSKSKGIGWTDEMLEVAIDNAWNLQGDHECSVEWCSCNNPSTMVHVLAVDLKEKDEESSQNA